MLPNSSNNNVKEVGGGQANPSVMLARQQYWKVVENLGMTLAHECGDLFVASDDALVWTSR
jgi:hypothetical protein